MTFKKVASACDLWSGEMIGIDVDGQKVLIVNLGDTFCAYEDRCAHKGVPLSEGCLKEQVLTCSAHHWQYDVSTGRGVNPSTTLLRRRAVRVEDGAVYVSVEEESHL